MNSDEADQRQPQRDEFQPLDGRQQREHGAELVEFQVVLLHQKHRGSDGGEAERAVGLQYRRRVQAAEPVGEIRLRPVRRIERRHQRKDADGEQHRRGERAEKLEARQQRINQARQAERPEQERGGFVKIVDRATVQRQAALEHRQRVQRHAGGEQEIIHPVVPAEAFAPEENRVEGAQAVKHHGQQKAMSVSEPSHADRLVQKDDA